MKIIIIQLIDIQFHPIHVEWWIDVIGVTIGDKTRSLLYFHRDGKEYCIDLFFIHIKS